MSPTVSPSARATQDDQRLANMNFIAGGAFAMGSNDHYPEERPVHRVAVDSFWIDRYPVTNAVFSEFVKATGYVTAAEIAPDAKDYPGAKKNLLKPGSLVFARPSNPVDLRDFHNWWKCDPRRRLASSARPQFHDQGTRASSGGAHLVMRTRRRTRRGPARTLPTEAEWEFAARGGLEAAAYAWGDEMTPDGRHMANTWQGEFPWQNLKTRRVRGDVAGRELPVERLRPLRHDRQRLGMDRRLVLGRARRRDPSRRAARRATRAARPRMTATTTASRACAFRARC